MSIYFRSQLNASGSNNADVSSYYIVQGENRWLSGDPNSVSLRSSVSNDPIIIGNNVYNISPLNFNNATSFNSPVTISSHIKNCYNFFSNCTNFNQPVVLYNGIENSYGMFINCHNFNQPVNIPDSVNSCYYMFSNCHSLNQPISMPNNFEIKTTYEMFSNCYSFNQPINMPDGVTNCPYMFENCYNLNQPVHISNNAIDCNYLFTICYNFNQPVNMPDSVITCEYMFQACYNLNQPVHISNNAVNCVGMFYSCHNFNRPVNVPDSVIYCSGMFTGCGTPLVIFGNNARYLSSTFGSCQRDVNVYIKYSGNDTLYVNRMFYGWGEPHNSVRKNVFFNPKWTSLFKKTLNNESITGYNTTWTDMTNGFYNAQYKVYCYNNYTG